MWKKMFHVDINKTYVKIIKFNMFTKFILHVATEVCYHSYQLIIVTFFYETINRDHIRIRVYRSLHVTFCDAVVLFTV